MKAVNGLIQAGKWGCDAGKAPVTDRMRKEKEKKRKKEKKEKKET